VEIDPRIGLRAFDAIRRLKADYAWAIDLEISFSQENLTNDPGAEDLWSSLRRRSRPDRRLPLY
jgi:cytosine deaminase